MQTSGDSGRQPNHFEGLFRKELGLAEEECAVATGASDEPRVTFVARDTVGLSLSGGGIRSATFNLGLLQALAELGWLGHFDYLSTVSGGGYVGGFFSVYLARRGRAGEPPIFPGGSGPEPKEIRHLREFGNFLAPRVGFFQNETWTLITSFLAALAPGVTVTTALGVLFVNGVLGVGWLLDTHRLAAFFALSFVHLLATEVSWQKTKKAMPEDRRTGVYVFASVLLVLVGAFVLARFVAGERFFARPFPVLGGWAAPGAGWFASRWLLSRFVSPQARGAVDRAAVRLLALCGVVGVTAVGLQLAVLVEGGLLSSWVAPTGAAISGGLFGLLIKKVSTQTREKAVDFAKDALKRRLPQVLSLASLALMLVSVATLVVFSWAEPSRRAFGQPLGPFVLEVAAATVLVALVLFDPKKIGLHAAYSGRIARAFLGAVYTGDTERRATADSSKDDLAFARMPARPLHLVCCTANDLAGDPLATLDRGGQSATLSRHGFAIADRHRPLLDREIGLASALTASAAAFNSNMGSFSVWLGRASTFLMSALNLRLGCWLAHPRSLSRHELATPGCLYFTELFGLTRAQGNWVHLSDGGHFENLALYELVRRRTRYVVVSDAGRDPESSFDDLGNALARIRTDFGVEVRLDLCELRPDADGLCRGHGAVGEIVYGPNEFGLLLYLRPALTGDEPEDVRKYRRKHPDFPHESTGDQFYGEEQWEAYRRLGHHVARSIFGRPELAELAPKRRTSELFQILRQALYPLEPGVEETFLELTARYGALEARIGAEAPPSFLAELYPELFPPPSGAKERDAATDRSASLSLSLAMAQLIEDVVVGGKLSANETHPLNLGWTNVFSRWTRTPTFRLFWPLLRPGFNAEARRFVEHELGVPSGLLSLEASRGTPWSFALCLESEGVPAIAVPVATVTLDVARGEASFTPDGFVVAPGFWGAGVGTRVLELLLEELRAEAGVDRVLVVPESSASTPHDRGEVRERAAGLQFFLSHGFQARRDGTLELVLHPARPRQETGSSITTE